MNTKLFPFLFIFFLLFVCFSCLNETKSVSKEDTFKEDLENAAHSSIKTDSIFLDIQFGMTEKDVKKHLDALVKKKKIGKNKNGDYFYSFNAEVALDIPCLIQPGYYYDQLYELILLFDNSLAASIASMSYVQKGRNENFKWHVIKNHLNESEDYFIKDNLVIHTQPEKRKITYLNYPVYTKYQNEKAEKQKEKSNETLSDI